MLRLVLLFAFLSLMLCSTQANNPLKLHNVQRDGKRLAVTVTRECRLMFYSKSKKTFSGINYMKNGILFRFEGNPVYRYGASWQSLEIKFDKDDALYLPTANLVIKEDILSTFGTPGTIVEEAWTYHHGPEYIRELRPPVTIYENGELKNETPNDSASGSNSPGSHDEPPQSGASGSNSGGFYDQAKSKWRKMFGHH